MFVGEGPGADEDAQGEPFVGRAGQLLNNMISAMGLRREDVYIANVVKCRPPQNRTPEREECETCSPFLMRQIAVVRPKIIVALGAVAANTLLGINDSMAKLRGRIYDFSPALPKDAPERRAPVAGAVNTADPKSHSKARDYSGAEFSTKTRRNLSSRLPAARSAAEKRSLAGLADGDALSRTYRPRQERRARLSRMSEQFCDVALPLPLDTTFTYKIDGAPVIAGGRVIVPFREKRLQGIVLRLHDQPPSRKLKSVIAALDSMPVLDESLLTLGAWIARYYLAPLGEVYRSMLPLAAEFKQVIAYSITERGTEALYESAAAGSSKRSHLDPERQMAEYAVLDYLAEGELVREATLRSATGATREMLRNLVAKKWIAREDLSSARDARRTIKIASLKEDEPSPPAQKQSPPGPRRRQVERQSAEDRGPSARRRRPAASGRTQTTCGSENNACNPGPARNRRDTRRASGARRAGHETAKRRRLPFHHRAAAGPRFNQSERRGAPVPGNPAFMASPARAKPQSIWPPCGRCSAPAGERFCWCRKSVSRRVLPPICTESSATRSPSCTRRSPTTNAPSSGTG